MSHKPTRFKYAILAQICQLIPPWMVSKLAREHGVDKKARTFSPWSHVVSLLYTHLAHALSLNDVCDALKNHGAKLATIRRASAPRRNTLSHASRSRNPAMAEALFWNLLDHLSRQCPMFGGRTYKGLPRRFKRVIHVVDASTIQLVANCMDWAKHRRKKAAAKLHLRLNLQSFLPAFAVIDTAKHHDSTRAQELCAAIGAGEIVVFDKAYVDFLHLLRLAERGVFWITRAKTNMRIRCVRKLLRKPKGNILRDDLVKLIIKQTNINYPKTFRRVVAIVEVDGREKEMTFITNNLEWSAASIADLYKSRWAIECFFKEIKQTLQLCDFLGHNKNAILWQVWTALTLYLLLRFLAFVNDWRYGFKRLFCLLRSTLWDGFQLVDLLKSCGTAHGGPPLRGSPEQAYLPGFEPAAGH